MKIGRGEMTKDMSSDLLKEIYDTVICRRRDAVDMGCRVDREILEMLGAYQEKLSEEEYEEIKDTMRCLSVTAEREGFLLGVKYAVMLLCGIGNMD